MKLLYINKRIGKGGVPSVLLERLNYLVENTNFEIHILSEFKNDTENQARFNSKIHFHLLEIQNLTSKKRWPIIGYFQLSKEVKKEYQKVIDILQPDIITGFNFGYNKEILPYLKTKSLKVIELHGSFANRELVKQKKDIIDYFKIDTKKLQNKYDYAVVLTHEDLNDRSYLKVNKKHIYNSIKLPEEISSFRERDNIIIAAGTLTHNKNFIDLIEAVRLIKDNLINWKIHIYGEGRDKIFLQNKINEYELDNIIQLKGYQYDMSVVYSNAKMLISTSISEGFGRTLTEALSYRVPVISYNCKCGPKEIISHGINGYLIDFDVKVLSEKIQILTSDKDLLLSFSENAWIDMEKFDYNNIMNQWVKFYESIGKSKF